MSKILDALAALRCWAIGHDVAVWTVGRPELLLRPGALIRVPRLDLVEWKDGVYTIQSPVLYCRRPHCLWKEQVAP